MTEREKQIYEMAKVMANSRFVEPDRKQLLLFAGEAETLYNAGYRKQSENTVEVVRCKDCRYLGRKDDDIYLKQCERCGDINEPCGYCVMFGCCTNENGYCYLGERSKE